MGRNHQLEMDRVRSAKMSHLPLHLTGERFWWSSARWRGRGVVPFAHHRCHAPCHHRKWSFTNPVEPQKIKQLVLLVIFTIQVFFIYKVSEYHPLQGQHLGLEQNQPLHHHISTVIFSPWPLPQLPGLQCLWSTRLWIWSSMWSNVGRWLPHLWLLRWGRVYLRFVGLAPQVGGGAQGEKREVLVRWRNKTSGNAWLFCSTTVY